MKRPMSGTAPRCDAHFLASIVELGNRDEGRIIVTRLHEDEWCFELQQDVPDGKTIKKVGFALLSRDEIVALIEALNRVTA